MKREIKLVSLILLILMVYTDSALANDIYTVESYNDGSDIIVNFHVDDYELQETVMNGKNYYKIFLPKTTSSEKKDDPDMPHISLPLMIENYEYSGELISSSCTELILDWHIVCSLGPVMRTDSEGNAIDINTFSCELGPEYSEDNFFTEENFYLNAPFIQRDVRGVVLDVYPVRYNPIQRKLEFCSDISLKLTPIGPARTNPFEIRDLSTIQTDFGRTYNRFENLDGGVEGRYDSSLEQGSMLVITYDDFFDDMQPFVKWKNKKGILTRIVNLSDVGDTSADIKDYITQQYDTDDLTFVLLVGDGDQLPSYYLAGAWSDPSYGYLVGEDFYPEVLVGRFSAQNSAQVETQVERTINYENVTAENVIGNGDWYGKAIGITSDESYGDEDEDLDEHMDNIRDDLLGYTYTSVDQLYQVDGTVNNDVISSAINEGKGLINYCGHGNSVAWAADTPQFQNDEVNELTNNNMLPIIWSMTCLNGAFVEYDTSFAEAWMRATNNGEPSGAVGMFATSILSMMDPPMEAQDEMNLILTGLSGNSEAKSFGGISYDGSNSMIENYGPSGAEEAKYYTLFGDPSLQVRTDVPFELQVLVNQHPHHQDPYMVSVVVSRDDDSQLLNGALVSLSSGGDLLSSGYTDESGVVELDVGSLSGLVDLVVTAQNSFVYEDIIEVDGGEECSGWLKGDVNQDQDFNILDLVLITNMILHTGALDCELWAADYNNDEEVNILDIVSLVDFILQN